MIKIRSIFGDDIRIKRRLDYYDAGNGPMLSAEGVSGSGPIPSQTIFDRFNVPILDRFGVKIETRFSDPTPSQTIFDRFNMPILDRFGVKIETRF